MGFWSRLRRGKPEKRSALSFDDWVDFFNYANVAYPFLRNSMSALDEETIGSTLTQVAKSNGLVFALI